LREAGFFTSEDNGSFLICNDDGMGEAEKCSPVLRSCVQKIHQEHDRYDKELKIYTIL